MRGKIIKVTPCRQQKFSLLGKKLKFPTTISIFYNLQIQKTICGNTVDKLAVDLYHTQRVKLFISIQYNVTIVTQTALNTEQHIYYLKVHILI